jgi:hypothetical protein
MPGTIVHLGATVICTHGGQAMPTAPFSRVLVSGQPIATLAAPYLVAGCPFNVGVSPVPCVTGQWLVGSTRVLAGGMPVVLNTGVSTCIPNGTPMNVLVTQTRVTAT